jgi:hypothetical protein
MKFLRTMCLLLVLSFAVGVLGQGQPAPAAKPATPAAQPQPQQPPPTLSSVFDRQLSGIEKNVVEAAEAMPEEKYNFTPESLDLKGSDYKGVRTFAMEVKHIATANYLFWTSVTGDAMPAGIKGPNGPDELKTKAEIVKFLKDSFALGHKAVAALTGDNALEMLQFRQNKAPRIQLTTGPLPHANDHYGQMVEYLRMNGVVPPASRPQN